MYVSSDQFVAMSHAIIFGHLFRSFATDDWHVIMKLFQSKHAFLFHNQSTSDSLIQLLRIYEKMFYQKASNSTSAAALQIKSISYSLFFCCCCIPSPHPCLLVRLSKSSVKTLNGQRNLCFSWHIVMIKEFSYIDETRGLKYFATAAT